MRVLTTIRRAEYFELVVLFFIQGMGMSMWFVPLGAVLDAKRAGIAVRAALQAAVDAPARSAAGRALDGGRQPARMLADNGQHLTQLLVR